MTTSNFLCLLTLSCFSVLTKGDFSSVVLSGQETSYTKRSDVAGSSSPSPPVQGEQCKIVSNFFTELGTTNTPTKEDLKSAGIKEESCKYIVLKAS